MAEWCPKCRRPVRHVLTESGRRLALDTVPSPDGTVIVERLDDGTVRGRILHGASPEAPGDTVEAFTQHRATCGRGPADRRPSCRACSEPMGRARNAADAALVAAERWVEHPACDTPAAAARARYALERARTRHVQTELEEATP